MSSVLCIALMAASAKAEDAEPDPSLPSYRPVAGVVGVMGGHSTAEISELMKVWGADFERIYPSVRVVLDDASFEHAGGAATFGPSVGMMREPTIGRFKKRFGYAAMEIPVCFYALAIFVHRDNPHERGLPIERLESILSYRFKDLSWGDLGCAGDWSERPIRLYAPRHHARPLLWSALGAPCLFKDSLKLCSDDAAVVTAVAGDTRALGIASIGRRTEEVRALAIAPKGSSEFVPATADNARNGSYPLADAFYLVLNHDPQGGFELDPLRREFLRYILSREGQQAVIKAGHVALSAEQAEQALAQFGLFPTGKGSWDQMMARLRARGLPRMEVTKIEHLTQKVGDQPTDEQLADLSNSLARTTLTSSVVVATDESGAIVKCRLFGQPQAVLTLDQATRAEATVPIGLYNIWTERDGKATSPTDVWFHVIREEERIKIYETREAIQRTTDGEVPDR